MDRIKCAKTLSCSAVALKEWCQVFVTLCNLTTRASSLCSTNCDSTSCPSDQMLSCIQTFVCWLTSLVSLAATDLTFLSSCNGIMSKQSILKTDLVISVLKKKKNHYSIYTLRAGFLTWIGTNIRN